MLTQNMYYQEEKKHASSRLAVLVIITFFSFIFYEQASGNMVGKMLLVSLVLGGLTLISMAHYFLMVSKPNTLVAYRKNFLKYAVSNMMSISVINSFKFIKVNKQ